MWSKAWLETRWKLVLMAVMDAGILSLFLDDGGAAAAWQARLEGPIPLLFLVNAVVLASAGIDTQTSFRPRQALHGSMIYTLSLPITRRRLVLVREAVGGVGVVALVLAALSALRVGAPGAAAQLGGTGFAAYAVAVLAAAAVAYGVSAVFATFLDTLWRTYAALAVVVGIALGVPGARFWAEALPAASGSVWPGVAAAALLAALLVALSVRLVRCRDF